MILCRQRSYFCCSDAPSPSSFERLEHYEGTSSPTLRWSGLPISNTSAGTFLPRPPKSPSLNDWYWTSPAHRQRPSGEVRYCRAPLDTKRPRHIISTQKIEGDPLLRSVPNPFSLNNTTTLVLSCSKFAPAMCVSAFTELYHPPYRFGDVVYPSPEGQDCYRSESIRKFSFRSTSLQSLIKLLCRPWRPFDCQQVYPLLTETGQGPMIRWWRTSLLRRVRR